MSPCTIPRMAASSAVDTLPVTTRTLRWFLPTLARRLLRCTGADRASHRRSSHRRTRRTDTAPEGDDGGRDEDARVGAGDDADDDHREGEATQHPAAEQEQGHDAEGVRRRSGLFDRASG